MKTHAITISILVIVCCGLLAGCGKSGAAPKAKNHEPKTEAIRAVVASPKSFDELVALSPEELKNVDIARMNLLCTEGLPGSEALDIESCLTTLDKWATAVKQAEQKYMSQYFQNSARYDHSVAKFKAVNLALTLKNDLGCGYNMNLIQSGAMADVLTTRFFRNSQDLFLHGFIEKQSGSCSSLPVLMVAVGRRCGYPLYVVTCKGHSFCRWDEDKERFNIETALEGVDCKPDSYFRQWPHPSTNAEVQSEGYLKSLAPSEELAVFAQLRAACLQENQRFTESVKAYEIALKVFPGSKFLKQYLNNVKGRQ